MLFDSYLTLRPVHHDAAHIKSLTKADIVEFFDHYLSPASPLRSKLSIYLHAQGTSPVAEGTAVEKAVAITESETPSLEEPSRKNDTIVIEDVRDFKASLAVTTGARAVKDLSEFEELDAKL